jgi:hypothetical protein
MKKCGYCGHGNDDPQTTCSECGTPFERAPLTDEQKASVLMGIGFVLQIIARQILLNSDPRAPSQFLGLAVLIVGVAVLVWGCRQYAFAKGYPRWLGWLGILSCLGPVALYLMPKPLKEAGAIDRPREQSGAP